MPKKTRKQKLQAKERRRHLVLRTPSAREIKVGKPIHQSTNNVTEIRTPSIHTKQPSVFGNSEQLNKTFHHDLSKSIIITTILIAIQFGLYLSTKNNVFDISSVIRFLIN